MHDPEPFFLGCRTMLKAMSTAGYQEMLPVGAGKRSLRSSLGVARRRYRDTRVSVDVIRFAKGRGWITHVARFNAAAFSS
jgi:hypothetical protein